MVISEETKQRFTKTVEIAPNGIIDGIKIPITLKADQWTRILEQLVLMILILGRFLLPKGNLSRFVLGGVYKPRGQNIGQL